MTRREKKMHENQRLGRIRLRRAGKAFGTGHPVFDGGGAAATLELGAG
jgi:hypothetical protein